MNDSITRRTFLERLSIGLGLVAAAIISVPVVAAILEPLLKVKPKDWRVVGVISDFEIGTTNLVSFLNAFTENDGPAHDKSAAWLRRIDEHNFIAFSVNCTHMGCPVRWEKDAELFMCPCHGGVYYKDGSVAAGPPPKALQQYPVRTNNGHVEILTSPIPLTKMTA